MIRRLSMTVAIASLAGSALGDELYRQDHADCVAVVNHCFGGLASQDARNQGGLGWMYEAADNFDAPAGWTITNLEFWGTQGSTTPNTTDGFMIRFYADNNGQPGALLLTQDVFTFTQDTYFTWIPSFPITSFHYTLNLNQPFAVPSAGRYWLAIVGIQPYGGNPDYRQWFWNPSNSLHGPTCVQDGDPPSQVYVHDSFDLSFVLYGSSGAAPCYPNCDSSTTPPILNVQDFSCFLNSFASGETYANCDHSTTAPVLNVQDFSCFLNAFAVGCT